MLQRYKVWVLPNNYQISYPAGKILNILEKETLKLPFKHSEIKATNFAILKKSSNGAFYIENMFDSARLVKNPRSKLGVQYLQVSGLDEGRYEIWLKKENVRFTVIVHNGKHWPMSADFLLSERALIFRGRQRLDTIRIDDLQIGQEG